MDAITGWLEREFPEVDPLEFYRELFPAGELESKGVYNKGEYHAVAVRIVGKDRAKRYSVTDDLDVVRELVGTDDFCVMSPVSYAGKSQSQRMARFLYAVAIDLDGIVIEDGRAEGLHQLWYQMTRIRETAAAGYAIPVPTYIVSSGRGVHLYYMLERPVPMFRNVIEQLSRLRRALVTKIWNSYVTTLSQNRQFESVTQGFRMVGTATKDGGRVRAFRTGGKVSVEYLNGHVAEESRLTTFSYKSDLTLERARERYPEWYQSRVVEGRAPGTWTAKRDLYDWWKRKIMAKQGGAVEGHRYFCVMSLAVYARKCGIARDELEADAFALIDEMNGRGDAEKNPFTEEDVVKALEAYNASYQTFPRRSIEELTAIKIPANKRNGRKQATHIALVNNMRKFARDELGEDSYANNGRPRGSGTKRDAIRAYAAEHPEVSHSEIARALGVSRPTVIKWLKPGWREEWEIQMRRERAKVILRRDDEGRWVVVKLEGHPEAEGCLLDRPRKSELPAPE